MPGFDENSGKFIFLIAVVSDDLTSLAEGPAAAWIEHVTQAAAPDLRGPIKRNAHGLYVRTSSYVDVPGLRARVLLGGYDGMWITPGRDELGSVFGKADAVVMLGDDSAQYEGRLAYLLDEGDVKAVRAVAHRNAKAPAGTHDIAIHGDWTTRNGALAVFKPVVMQVAKKTAGRATAD